MGVEPIRCHHQRILSPSRLPIPTHRLICCLYSILQACQKIKIYFALIFTSQIRSKSILDIPRMRAILYCLVLKKTINTKTKHTNKGERMKEQYWPLMWQSNLAVIKLRGAYADWARANGMNYHELLVFYSLHELGSCTQKQICARSTVGWMCKKSGC